MISSSRLVFQECPLALPSVGRFDQGLPLLAQELMFLSGLAVGADLFAEPAVRVEKIPLPSRVEQGSALELTLNVDQAVAKFLQCGDGDWQPVDMRAAAALRRDPARDDEGVVFDGATQRDFDFSLQHRVVHMKNRCCPCLELAGSDHVGRRFSAQDERQCGQKQAFACPGFSCPGAVAVVELDVRVFDECQVLDREFAKHEVLSLGW